MCQRLYYTLFIPDIVQFTQRDSEVGGFIPLHRKQHSITCKQLNQELNPLGPDSKSHTLNFYASLIRIRTHLGRDVCGTGVEIGEQTLNKASGRGTFKVWKVLPGRLD